jgi:drug/metabolite transporter (DMT)-like permease
VATFHNLIPICTIFLAHVTLGEPIGLPLLIGGTTILIGIELVRKGEKLFPLWAQWWLMVRKALSGPLS